MTSIFLNDALNKCYNRSVEFVLKFDGLTSEDDYSEHGQLDALSSLNEKSRNASIVELHRYINSIEYWPSQVDIGFVRTRSFEELFTQMFSRTEQSKGNDQMSEWQPLRFLASLINRV